MEKIPHTLTHKKKNFFNKEQNNQIHCQQKPQDLCGDKYHASSTPRISLCQKKTKKKKKLHNKRNPHNHDFPTTERNYTSTRTLKKHKLENRDNSQMHLQYITPAEEGKCQLIKMPLNEKTNQ